MSADPAPTGYSLVVDATGERHTIDRKLVIGRESSGIAIDDLEASRRHATVRPLDDGGLELYDLDSANGTFVNEVRVGPQPLQLQPGDVIRVGRSQLRVERLTSAADRQHMPTVIPCRPSSGGLGTHPTISSTGATSPFGHSSSSPASGQGERSSRSSRASSTWFHRTE